MPRYVFEGFGADGRPEHGEIEGPDEAAVYSAALGSGVTVTKIRRAGDAGLLAPWYKRELERFSVGAGLAVEAEIADQLSVMFRAQLPLPRIIGILAESGPNKLVQAGFRRVGQRIADGASFAEAVEQSIGTTSPVFRSLLQLADKAPNPADLMQVLAAALRRRRVMSERIRGTLVYPAILLIAALAVMLLVTFYLVPNISPMFENIGRPLPAGLQFFAAIRETLISYGRTALIVSAALIAAVVLTWWTGTARRARHSLMLVLPVIGPMTRLSALSRLVQSTDMLLRAGSPLPDALRDSAAFESGSGAAQAFAAAAEALESGQTAASVFLEDRHLPPAFRKLFQVGEVSNTLPVVLPALASSLDQQIERQTEQALRLLTPILTLLIGGGAGLLIYSVMDAILSVNDLAF